MTYIKADAGLPAGWEVRLSKSRNIPYYFNESQKTSLWEPPTGTDIEKLKKYVAENYDATPKASAVDPTEGKIRVRHLLVKHKDSRRPSSWREVGLLGIGSNPGCYRWSDT